MLSMLQSIRFDSGGVQLESDGGSVRRRAGTRWGGHHSQQVRNKWTLHVWATTRVSVQYHIRVLHDD
eukprot:10447210-Heterocapsa_arctica.AAC.1